jgi:carboxyl-terminal processing protease
MMRTPAPATGEVDSSSVSPRLTAARNWLSRSLVAVMLLVAIGAGIGIDRLVLVEFAPAGAQDDHSLVDSDEFTILEQTYNVIRENYVQSDDITDEQLIYGASEGMVDALGDEGHSRFLDPEAAERFEASSRGELVGIGIQVDTDQLPLRVIMPVQGSPADEAGVLAGDLILTIDGVDATDLGSPDDAFAMIAGEEGTQITLELQHEGAADTYEVTLTRTRIDVDSISWAMLPGDILWIRISQFSSGTTESLRRALQAGTDQGAKGVILDLRANPGGLVFESLGVGSQFQPNGSVLYQQEDAAGDIVEIKTVGHSGLWQEGPLVVLIDGDSASASEITSSSISDNGRGLLVGEQTFGTGTVLLPMELTDGSMVLIGTDLWLTPNGDVIWHQGVEPDLAVENEPGVQITLPYSYDDNVVTDQQFGALEDDQLLSAYEHIVNEVEDSGS